MMSLTNNNWHVVKDYDKGFVGVGCTAPWTCLGIADIHHDIPNIEERVEVAELIASAPELKRENQQLKQRELELRTQVERLREGLSHAIQCWEYDGISEEHGAVAMECDKRINETPQQALVGIQSSLVRRLATSFLLQHEDQRRISVQEVIKWLGNQVAPQANKQG